MTIVPFKKHRGKSVYGKLDSAEAVMNVLRIKMYEWHYTDLAKEIGKSASCIMAIRSGRTKWPRPDTFFALLDVFDMEIQLREK